MNSLISALKAAIGKILPARPRTEERQIIWSREHASDAAGEVVSIEISYGEDSLRPIRISYKEGFRADSALETMAQEICHVTTVLLSQEGVELEAIEGLLAKEQSLHRGRVDFVVLVEQFTRELLKPPMWSGALTANGGETDA